jgi:phosphopantothenoylcysteine decarboxylase/phosphopantothenate--cysteine ligase
MATSPTDPLRLLVGVTGGVAAFKTAALVSQLVQRGVDVQVVMTRDAKRFVGPATFAALTGKRVLMRTFDQNDHSLGPHIELARAAQVMLVAPATANFLAKAACGIADDLLCTLVLSFTGPLLVAPAMNAEMWTKPAVQRNVETLQGDGVTIISPGSGWLSCREAGAGRMAEPADISSAIAAACKEHRLPWPAS